MANPAIWQISHWELTLRILFALVVGGLIGLEREFGHHSAGFRTHILVCLGSALVMLLSIYGFSSFMNEPNVRSDPARLAAQVISGIGFLGAGTILRTGNSISGLTTAASLWVVAALGLAVGAGFYYGALLTAFLSLVCLFVLNKLEKVFNSKRRMADLTLTLKESSGSVQSVMEKVGPVGATITNLSAGTDPNGKEEPAIQLHLRLKNTVLERNLGILDELRGIPGVIRVTFRLSDGKGRSLVPDDPMSGDV
ncbi:hypothetical protein GE107_21770 [Cohnella sp. CFH 77786]|uniref:MgtC/SapB family protein n=1 Tax=Cohnella sp. CFH 77786 TaxID=2662265 RepID=UPI001C608D8D|nr:MgtC/SapB family protein [Cohnella sp. CFH 77786]MBW5448677.1 hypothetical protein [Cohnella sp. CFH 77786]